MARNQQALRSYDVVQYSSADADDPEQRRLGERLDLAAALQRACITLSLLLLDCTVAMERVPPFEKAASRGLIAVLEPLALLASRAGVAGGRRQ